MRFLKGDEAIELRRDTITKETRRVAVKTLVSEEDEPLFSALKAKRRALAEALNAPAYVVFADAVLMEMARTRPKNIDDFARLSGVGAVKLERYGDAFLQVINGASEAVHPSRRKLAGRDTGGLFDQLQSMQIQLATGPHGYDKPMACSASLLAKVAQSKPKDMAAVERLLGEKKAERFGEAFLEVLQGE